MGSESLAALIAALPPERAAAVFTHSSWAVERSESYERLEFLGDSVLELAIAHTLYDRFPDFDEGQMAKIRSHVVSRASCAVISAELGLGERLLAGKTGPDSGEQSRLVGNRNVLAAVLEAALAAFYLEHGFEPIAGAIVEAFESRIQYALTNQVDHKTELQETLARRGRLARVRAPRRPRARRTSGSSRSAAIVDGEQAGVGRGSSKKDAEQQAAREALERLAAAAGEPAAETG